MQTKDKKTDAYTCKRIQQWYKSLFEKYGWMVLSIEFKGNKVKLDHYHDSLKRLSVALNNKMKQVQDDDRLEDLKIMAEHLDILIKAANKQLKY